MYKSAMVASLLAVSLALTAGSASAQSRSDSGWYLGAQIGQSTVDIEGCGGGVDCDDKDTAWRILGGYQINRNFAVELGFHEFGDASASGPGGRIDFQTDPAHVPPTWPDPASSMQLHLHFRVHDLDAAERAVLALGGTMFDDQPGDRSRVYADPAGHPFCLVPTRDRTE